MFRSSSKEIAATTVVANHLITKKLEVVDIAERPRIRLSVAGDTEPRIEILDENGTCKMIMTVLMDGGPTLRMTDDRGAVQFSVTVNAIGDPEFRLGSPDGSGFVSMRVNEQAPIIEIGDSTDTRNVKIYIDNSGLPRIEFGVNTEQYASSISIVADGDQGLRVVSSDGKQFPIGQLFE